MIEELNMSPDMFIRTHGEFRGSLTAFVYDDHRVTWAEFDARVSKVANALLQKGLCKGDKVSLLGLNCIETLEILFGTLRAGGVIVPISSFLTPDLLASLITDSDSRFLFVVSPLEQLAAPIVPTLDTISAGSLISVGFEDENWVDYENFIANASVHSPDVSKNIHDECSIIYSSGTTGVPKGIMHSQLVRVFCGYAACTEFRIDSSATMIITTPIYTNATWMMLLGSIVAGNSTVLFESFSPETFFTAVEKERGTHTFLVPTQYQVILDHPDFNKHDLSSLRIMVSMGSTLPLPLKQRILDEMGPGLIELYGCTEGPATTLKPEETVKKIGSVGTPLSGSIICIIDDLGNELPRGEIGEIVGYTPGAMTGYYKRPEATADAIWYHKNGKAFIRTGDIGRMDEDGFLYILDRKKDMLVSGGGNVYASAIEEVFLQHPQVYEVGVIAVPHKKWIETPLAIVRLQPDSIVTEDELKLWTNDCLAKHQRVCAVKIREEEFPRNPLGKLLKMKLREFYWKDKTPGRGE